MSNNVNKASEQGYVAALDGIMRKTLVYGERTLMTEFKLQSGSTLPEHSHPHEQTGYLVSGHIVLSIGGTGYDIRPGDSWVIPGDEVHSAEVKEDSVAVEVWCFARTRGLSAVNASNGSTRLAANVHTGMFAVFIVVKNRWC